MNDEKLLLKKKRKIKQYTIKKGIKNLDSLQADLPDKNQVLKMISFGGFSSIAIIAKVAKNEIIEDLTVTSLRIGKKEIRFLNYLFENNKLKKAQFFTGDIFKEDENNKAKYNYIKIFKLICEKNNWKYKTLRNHSKIILMKTNKNFYVLETSSNLNANPSIEQFNLENCEETYNFYKNFLGGL